MTISIVGRCEETGQMGIAISSSSIAVGARCPWPRGGVGAVSSQNVTLPSIGEDLLDKLAEGLPVQRALDEVIASINHPEYRQVLVIDHQGETAIFSGEKSLGLNSSKAGHQCIAAGNMLANYGVIEAMVANFESSSGELLTTRLIAALQAGADAGGEMGPIHSAAVKVVGDVRWPIVDLRVDWADDAPIAVLKQLWRDYAPQCDDYILRALDPTKAPSYGVPGDE